MRIIKFRGYNKKNGEWLFGSYILNRGHHFVAPDEFADSKTWEDYEVIEETIGQFTGLCDKNGKEIYEGDILRYPAKDKSQEENFVSFEVFWHDNDCADNHVGWQIDRRHFHGCICGTRDISTFLPRYTKKMVIIGNIHDNPELLER